MAEDGREFYAVNVECDYSKADWWVLGNVLKPIGLDREGFTKNLSDPSVSASYKNTRNYAKTREQIAFEVMAFVKRLPDDETSLSYDELYRLEAEDKVNFYGWYCDYDWVVFCQLFGRMIDLPKGFPMYCRDIKQLCDSLGNPKLPEQNEDEHHALHDARWIKKAYKFLVDYGQNLVSMKSEMPEF